jgi:hypothetical protein
MRGFRVAAAFADAACRSSMGAIVKARIMETYIRLPI